MPKTTQEDLAKICEEDILAFAALVNPNRLYGDIHHEVFRWLTRPSAKDNQLVLLPRGHQKSHLIAVWCAWWITKHPYTTILYVSGTEELAIAQLAAIKNILESDTYRRYWPEMIHKDEAKRTQWSSKTIKVDHPARKKMGVRDATVAARSIGGNTTGLHCDVLIADDIVIPDNAYTEEGRRKVRAGFGLFTSVKNPGAITKAVGTRYHPKDIYQHMIDMKIETYNDEGEVTGEEPVYEVFERVVETNGVFLWPREKLPKSKHWYGFDHKILASIRAQYAGLGELAQFYAQYYNDPNDPSSERVSRSRFQYYDERYLEHSGGSWRISGRPLSVWAGVDVAYTTGPKSDYTAIAVIGMDPDRNIYILDLDQFRTSKYEDYYTRLIDLHRKWNFRKVRIETNAGANLVENYLKDRARSEGLYLTIEGKPAGNAIKKEERISQILEPRYENLEIFHKRGGWNSEYEEQLVLARPTHDDLKDAVATAVEIAKPPARSVANTHFETKVVPISTRFGGWTRIRN